MQTSDADRRADRLALVYDIRENLDIMLKLCRQYAASPLAGHIIDRVYDAMKAARVLRDLDVSVEAREERR
jgi:hypothetical protein